MCACICVCSYKIRKKQILRDCIMKHLYMSYALKMNYLNKILHWYTVICKNTSIEYCFFLSHI